MVWQPINISEVCPSPTQLTACTAFAHVYLNLLVNLYADSYDKRIQENRQADDGNLVENILNPERNDYTKPWEGNESDDYDFIIVGAGSAGCVLANRLTEIKDWNALLLEVGPEEPDITQVPGLSTSLLGSNIDWGYTTQPDSRSCLANKGCPWPRGKVMGGSSSINSLVYIRGHKVDYDDWAAAGNEGWNYDEVLHCFIKSENNLNIGSLNRSYHGVGGNQAISKYPYVDIPSLMLTEAFHEKGLNLTDFNGPQQLGTAQAQAFSKDGQRVSANTAFIRPIRYKRKNLTVKPYSEVFKILIDENKRAYGVRYVTNGTIHEAFATKEVIVSGGAIGSPKLLILSGIGPKKHLDDVGIKVIKDLDVGKNLHDHITFNGIVIALSNKTATLIDKNDILKHVKDYKEADEKNGPLSGNGPVSSLAFIKTKPDLPAPDIQYQVNKGILEDYVSDPKNYDKLTIMPTAFYDAIMPRTMNLVTKSRGELKLNASNPQGNPLLYPNYFADESDFEPILRGVKFLISLEDTKAFKCKGAYFYKVPLKDCKDLIWGTDEYIKCIARSYTSSPYHPVGTCKMGPKWDNTAVVDPTLKVYGIKGLRVIDASIMPVVIRGNTNAPSLMIGEKGAELVKKDWIPNYVGNCRN